jgi:hypothetical protein
MIPNPKNMHTDDAGDPILIVKDSSKSPSYQSMARKARDSHFVCHRV